MLRERVACASCEVEEERDLRADRRRRQGQQGLVRGRAQGDQAEDARPVHEDRAIAAAARHSGEDERHRQVRHRRLCARHAVRRARAAAGALRRDGEVGRRERGQESAGLRQGRRGRGQDRHDHGLGRRRGKYLRGSEEGRGCAQDRLGQGSVCQRVRPVDHRRVPPSAEGRQGRLLLRQGRRCSRGDGKGSQGHRGRISDQPQHPRAARADECPRDAEGRGLAHLYRQSVLHAHDHHRVRGCRYRSQEHRDAPALPGRRLRAPPGVRTWSSRRSRRPRLSASR